MPERHKKFFKSNVEALYKGAAFARGEFSVEKTITPSEEPLETIAPTAV